MLKGFRSLTHDGSKSSLNRWFSAVVRILHLNSSQNMNLFSSLAYTQRQTHIEWRWPCPDGMEGLVPWQSAGVTAEDVKCEPAHHPESMDFAFSAVPRVRSLSITVTAPCLHLFLPIYSFRLSFILFPSHFHVFQCCTFAFSEMTKPQRKYPNIEE